LISSQIAEMSIRPTFVGFALFDDRALRATPKSPLVEYAGMDWLKGIVNDRCIPTPHQTGRPGFP
jgi:hypothetical protein